MPIDFPSSPLIGTPYTLNGRRYFWDGVKWNGAGCSVSQGSAFDPPGPEMFSISFVSADFNIEAGLATTDGMPGMLDVYEVPS